MRPASDIPLDLPSVIKMRSVLGRDAPKTLRYMGNLDLLSEPAIGFCGSRKASPEGLSAAEVCASEIAQRGLVVVAGNAAGVDTEAHRAALSAGGSTILVLPEGIEKFRVRRALRDVWNWDRVLVVSQWDDRAVWRTYQAMGRNNTIIGFSDSMIVIEAGEPGGTRHAGEKTLVYGIPLFVIEYREHLDGRAGNAELIRLGGSPLGKKKSDGRPNIEKVIALASDHWNAGPRQKGLM